MAFEPATPSKPREPAGATRDTARRDRTPREVIEDHLRLAKELRPDEDFRRNLAPDIAFLTSTGIYRGHEGLREQADALARDMGDAELVYGDLVVEDNLGFLLWEGLVDGRVEVRGADSYLVRDGRIAIQTIHYARRADAERRLTG